MHDPNGTNEVGSGYCYLLPLPQPLPLDHGAIVQSFRNPESAMELARPPQVRSSIKIHQVEVDSSHDMAVIERVASLAREVAGVDRDGGPSSAAPFPSVVASLTVAEVVVPRSDEASEDDSLGVAVEAVRHLQRACSLVSQDPVQLLTRHGLPAVLPVLAVELGGADGPTYTIASNLAAVDTRAMDRLVPVVRPALPFEVVSQAVQQVADGGPFVAAVDLRREAKVLFEHDGKYRMAALTFAMASEVLLDGLLMALLWEEGADPSVAQHMFSYQASLRSRVLSEYSSRLKGSWQKGKGAVGDYLRDVVQLRNRIAHVGYEPTEAEARRARDASLQLETHIGNRLRSPAIQRRYPRTAVLFCGADRLEAAGAMIRATRRVLEDPNEGIWIVQHRQWSDWARRFIEANPTQPGEDPDSIHVIIEVTESQERVIVVDEATSTAAEAPSASVWWPDGLQGEIVDRTIAAVRGAESPEYPVLIRPETNAIEGDPRLEGLRWARDYEIFPERDFRPPNTRGEDEGAARIPGQPPTTSAGPSND